MEYSDNGGTRDLWPNYHYIQLSLYSLSLYLSSLYHLSLYPLSIVISDSVVRLAIVNYAKRTNELC